MTYQKHLFDKFFIIFIICAWPTDKSNALNTFNITTVPDALKTPLLQLETPLSVQQNETLIFAEACRRFAEKITNTPSVDKTSILQAAAVASNDSCAQDVGALFKGLSVGNFPALQYFDAWGKPEAGIFQGAFSWIGSYKECQKLTSQNTKFSFDSKYYLTLFSTKLVPFNFTIASCLPSSCNASVIGYVVQEVFNLTGLGKDVTIYGSSSPGEDRPPESSTIAATCVLSALLAVCLAATLYDILFHQRKLNRSKSEIEEYLRSEQGINDSNGEGGQPGGQDAYLDATEYTPLVQKQRREQVIAQMQPQISLPAQAVLSFSLFTNGQKILSVENVSKDGSVLHCLHGLRFFSMTWVILGHTFAFIMSYLNDAASLRDIVKRWSFQAILSGTLSVDTFFFLSGVLITYLTLKELKHRGGVMKINWFWVYFHRFWRLTPAYMLSIAFFVGIWPHLGSGPLWSPLYMSGQCEKYWWTNLLYINNFIHEEKCLGWSWFLAVDMQFFVITPILFIIPFFVFWPLGVGLSLLALLATWLATGLVSAHHHIPAGFQGLVTETNQSKLGTDFNELYFKPWYRLGSYLAGVWLGYILYKTKCKFRMHKVFWALGWLVATVLALLVVYGLTGVARGEVHLSNGVSALYNTVHRTLWGLSLAWVVFACVTGNGGPVNAFLSWKALVPLSRLTYMAYLFHPMVIFWCYGVHQHTITYTDAIIVYYFLGHLVLSYGIAFIAAIILEAPFVQAEKVLMKKLRVT